MTSSPDTVRPPRFGIAGIAHRGSRLSCLHGSHALAASLNNIIIPRSLSRRHLTHSLNQSSIHPCLPNCRAHSVHTAAAPFLRDGCRHSKRRPQVLPASHPDAKKVVLLRPVPFPRNPSGRSASASGPTHLGRSVPWLTLMPAPPRGARVRREMGVGSGIGGGAVGGAPRSKKPLDISRLGRLRRGLLGGTAREARHLLELLELRRLLAVLRRSGLAVGLAAAAAAAEDRAALALARRRLEQSSASPPTFALEHAVRSPSDGRPPSAAPAAPSASPPPPSPAAEDTSARWASPHLLLARRLAARGADGHLGHRRQPLVKLRHARLQRRLRLALRVEPELEALDARRAPAPWPSQTRRARGRAARLAPLGRRRRLRRLRAPPRLGEHVGRGRRAAQRE